MTKKSSNLEKLIFFLKPKTIFSAFTKINFILKLFGLYPIKIEQTKKGPKPVLCIWGVILTTIHFIAYCFCYFVALNMKLYRNSINKIVFISIVSKFGTQLLLIMEGLTVFCLFLNVFMTFKAQRNMISLFHQAETKLKDKQFNNNFFFHTWLVKIFIFSMILLILNFLIQIFVAFLYFSQIKYQKSEEIIYFVARTLAHFYILVKSSQYFFYILILYYFFKDLNKRMISK